jgi:hypothetical protein
MLDGARTWLKIRRRKSAAVEVAVRTFEAQRKLRAMGGCVLRIDETQAIVRVMFEGNRKPPERAWYAVHSANGDVTELAFDQVAEIETAWR